MFWWDWTGKQKLMVFLGMAVIAALPWILTGWLRGWQEFLGGTAFLMLPEMMALMLLIGFKSGVMPLRRGKACRKESPVIFWMAALCYFGLLIFTLWIILRVTADIVRDSVA